MTAEQLVAAAAAATGPIVDGDLAGWSEQVRRAASSAVIIAADMERLLEALADPDLKMHVRKVTGVTQEKGRFIISYSPTIDVTFKEKTTSYNDFRTGWVEEPHARQIARTARESVGRQCIFFQLNEHNEGDAEAPASGYRRLIHLEPVPAGSNGDRVADRPQAAPCPDNQHERAAEPAPEPERSPVPAPEPQRAEEPPAQPTLDEPPAKGPPQDPAFRSTVASLLPRGDDALAASAPIPADALRAYTQTWWNLLLGGEGQAIIRRANDAAKAAGRPYVSEPHDPKTIGDLRLIANFSRALATLRVPA